MIFRNFFAAASLYHCRESHEGHRKYAGGDEGDRNTLEGLRHVVEGKLLTESGEDDHRKAIAERGREGIYGRLTEIEQVRLSPASSPAGRTNLVLALAAGS